MYAKYLRELLFLVKLNDVCEELLHIELRSHLVRFGHGEEFNVYAQLSQIICPLLSHDSVALTARALLICKKEDTLIVALLLNNLELLMADLKCFKERSLSIFSSKPIALSEFLKLILKLFDGLGVWGVKLLQHADVIEVERVLSCLAAIEHDAYLVIVACDNLGLHEAETGLKNLVHIWGLTIAIMRVGHMHRLMAIYQEHH